MMNQGMNQGMNQDQEIDQMMAKMIDQSHDIEMKTSTYHRVVDITPYIGHVFDEKEIQLEMTTLELKLIEKENIQMFYDLFFNVKQMMIQPILIWSLMMIACVCALSITKKIEQTMSTKISNQEFKSLKESLKEIKD